MAKVRFDALDTILERKFVNRLESRKKVSDYFGINVFNDAAMKAFLTEEAYIAVKESIDKGLSIDRKIADQVAEGMKSWAISKGATHYTHWFQPLNEATAEKHDAFFEPIGDGRVVEKFDGSQLVQQEPDASSLPSGGLRNTFEARGYTAWDPSSPAFIIDNTLCIPTIFVSYNGDALDYKTPLLRALNAIDKAAVDVMQYFDKNVNKVWATLGWEQEFFLIDEALYNARPDLVLTGRTLLGHSAPRGQQLEDHYFGSIPNRALAFMKELEQEAYKLGIPITTRHNEVAPNQFECAPVFEEVNLAVDHNQLLMDLMNKIAIKHKLRVLLHEKPFKGINGSGKHNNWSLMANTGTNLLSPGKTPKKNLRFLTFFINIIKAVHDYADLLRASIASAGNEHRLGANEAPPAIISVFIGSHLSKVLNEIENKVSSGKMSPDEKTELKLNIVGRIPEILLDNTDRNRTSPFAFTGNKFELRALGASANCASPMIVLNTIVANQLKIFKNELDQLIDKGLKKDEAIFNILKNYIKQSKNILFEGNNYSAEWEQEAKKRGLSNIKDTPSALKVYIDKKNIQLFKEMNVLTEREIKSRYEIALSTYMRKIQIEARTLVDLIQNHIFPAAIKYQNILLENLEKISKVLDKKQKNELTKNQEKILIKILNYAKEMQENSIKMVNERKKINKLDNIEKMAFQYRNKIFPYFDTIRYYADKLERYVDDELWPLPKYREILFTR